MPINTNPKKIEELLTMNVHNITDKKRLQRKMLFGKKLRIKHGIDPTGSNLHIGRAVLYWKLKKFQEMGHQIVIIIGDFTAQIGDASDKQAMRKPLTEKEIIENMKTYKKQLNKILDMSKIELRYNSEWLNKLSMKEMLKLSMKFTAQQMIQRTNFKERWKQNKPIGVHELLYPLLQGYDSAAIKADVEIGGFDQLFNLFIGREVQKFYRQQPQDIITYKMLYGLDGRKMSTSWGNVINILDSPNEQYGKIMSMKDELITNYLELAADIPSEKIQQIKNDIKSKKLSLKQVKVFLAKKIVSMYHSKTAADKAEKEFNRIFTQKKIPSKIKSIKLKIKEINILDLLVQVKLVSSKSEAKRVIIQRGVKIDNIVQDDWQKTVILKSETVIQVGKRKFIKIKLVA